MDPCPGCDQHMAGMEVSFDHSVGSLHEGPCPADRPVPSFLFDGKRMTPNRPVHRLVHRGRRFDAEIPVIPVDRLSSFREVDTTVMQRRGRRCQAADQLELCVNECVKFVAKLRSRSLLRPGSVPALPGPCLIATWCLGRRMPGIGGNERGILDHATTDFQTACIDLLLEVGPEVVDRTGINQAILEGSDRRTVGDRGRIPEEVMERDPVPSLPFELMVRETIPLLKHEQFHMKIRNRVSHLRADLIV